MCGRKYCRLFVKWYSLWSIKWFNVKIGDLLVLFLLFVIVFIFCKWWIVYKFFVKYSMLKIKVRFIGVIIEIIIFILFDI